MILPRGGGIMAPTSTSVEEHAMSAEPSPTSGSPSAERGDDIVTRLAERLGAEVNQATVYGEPVERNGLTVIPVASARFAFGGGSGGDAETQQEGGGGGGIGWVAPAGYIELRDTGSRFVPAVRPERMLLLIVGGALAGVALFRALGPRGGAGGGRVRALGDKLRR
jgi:uncharacterized spore protein YtfJ